MTSPRSAQTKDIQRLKELILLVAATSENDPRFDVLKLNKLLYYIDNRAYRELGHPLTEATYQRLDEGPAPGEMPRALAELQTEGAIDHETRAFHDHTQKRVVCRREAAPKVFAPEEHQIVRDVLDELFPMTGKQVSEQSRQEWGWRLTKEGDVIPFAASWLATGPLTQEQETAGSDLWNEISS
jgi:hypothetical protein